MTIGSLRDAVIRASFLVITIAAAIAQGCGDSDSTQDDRRLAESALDGLAADLGQQTRLLMRRRTRSG